MENRFKIRVWDKINEKWMHDTKLICDLSVLQGFYDNEQASKRRYVLMQCTGLKDKNGKLIYEGDIVEEGLKCVIEWNKECCGFVEVHANRLNQQKIFYPMFDNTDESRNTRCEVIGNIYENKELLNG